MEDKMTEPDVKTFVYRNLTIGENTFAFVVETRGYKCGCTVFSARHQRKFGPCLGGTRIRGGIGNNLEGAKLELAHLAAAMTLKANAAALPLDGFKTMVCCPEDIPQSRQEIAEILANHLLRVVETDAGCICAPDIGVDELHLDRVAGFRPSLVPNLAGTTSRYGGIEIDKQALTALGLAFTVNFLLFMDRLAPCGVVIQGAGAVGLNAARLLSRMPGGEKKFTIRGISNIRGALVARQEAGLDVNWLVANRHLGDNLLEAYWGAHQGASGFSTERNSLWEEPAELVIPAGPTLAFAHPDELAEARKENPDAFDVTQLQQTGARWILEAANAPLTEKAEEFLERHGCRILVDFIVNCGGLVGCYVENLYRKELLASANWRKLFVKRTKEFITRVIQRNLEALLDVKQGARSEARKIAEKNQHEVSFLLSQMPAEMDSPSRARLLLKQQGFREPKSS
jgi:glutamate dehydrogenase (NAD(P)+)